MNFKLFFKLIARSFYLKFFNSPLGAKTSNWIDYNNLNHSEVINIRENKLDKSNTFNFKIKKIDKVQEDVYPLH